MVFVKSPLPGRVKTRLGKDIGTRNAAQLYKKMLYQFLEKLSQNNKCMLELWCYPDTKHPFLRKCARDFNLVLKRQSGDDLGSKMNNAIRQSLKNYKQCVLVGSDIPDIDSTDIHQARQYLRDEDGVVILPTQDGGYGLIAMNTYLPILFRNMKWSTPVVMKHTLQRAKKNNIKYHLLAEKMDIDTKADWRRYKLSG